MPYLHSTEKSEHTAMLQSEFETTIPIFKRFKTVCALVHATTVMNY